MNHLQVVMHPLFIRFEVSHIKKLPVNHGKLKKITVFHQLMFVYGHLIPFSASNALYVYFKWCIWFIFIGCIFEPNLSVKLKFRVTWCLKSTEFLWNWRKLWKNCHFLQISMIFWRFLDIWCLESSIKWMYDDLQTSRDG